MLVISDKDGIMTFIYSDIYSPHTLCIFCRDSLCIRLCVVYLSFSFTTLVCVIQSRLLSRLLTLSFLGQTCTAFLRAVLAWYSVS